MASVDWQKATLQKAGAMKRHNGKSERVNGNHANPDIDKSKSHLNIYIGAEDYGPMVRKVRARIAEVDRKHPPKRNQGDRRITCILLETPVPQEITERGKAEEFLRKAHMVIEDFFGAENVGGTCGHFDEQHRYIGKDGKEHMSLVHGHTIVAAYAEWVDKKTGELRKGINGKNCETKARLTALNKAMNDMCQREYGISFNTSETPDRKSVERLKQETAMRREAVRLQTELDELQRQIETNKQQGHEFMQTVEKSKQLLIKMSSRPKQVTILKGRIKIESDAAYQLRVDAHQRAVAVSQAERELAEDRKNFEAKVEQRVQEELPIRIAEREMEQYEREKALKSLEERLQYMSRNIGEIVEEDARRIAEKEIKRLEKLTREAREAAKKAELEAAALRSREKRAITMLKQEESNVSNLMEILQRCEDVLEHCSVPATYRSMYNAVMDTLEDVLHEDDGMILNR